MKNMYYHHQINIVDALTQNHWVAVALAFIAIAVIAGMSQYHIHKCMLNKRFGDGPYYLIGITGAITIGIMMFVESLAGIIQLLDNGLVGNEPPLVSIIFAPFTAAAFGIIFGIIVAVIGDLVASFRKRSLIKKLRLAAEARRKANPQKIRRGQPNGKPRPGATRPTRYNESRDEANHRNHDIRVSAGKGMRRR